MIAVAWSHNLDAEQAVLGGLLTAEPADHLAVRTLLPDPSAFYAESHRLWYAAILALVDRRCPLDPVTLGDELRRTGTLDAAGGLVQLAEFIDAVPSAANVVQHAEIVRQRALRRALAEQAQAALSAAQDLSAPIEPAITATVDRLVRTAASGLTHGGPSVDEEFGAIMDDLERQAALGDAVTGIPSGLHNLDLLTDGWVKGRLIIVAARPKRGKTGLALHCADTAAESEYEVCFCTAEQPRRELNKRRLAMRTGANLRAITSPAMLDLHAGALSRAMADLRTRTVHIEQHALTPAAIRLVVQRQQAELGRVDLVIVDYLGKLHSGRRAERHDLEIGYMTGDLARLALDLDVPVLLMCQLNRESVKGGQIRRPTVSDLRDSGAIEQDAAQVIFLHHKDDDDAWPAHRMDLDLALNRFGPTGTVTVSFERTTGRWSPYLKLA